MSNTLDIKRRKCNMMDKKEVLEKAIATRVTEKNNRDNEIK